LKHLRSQLARTTKAIADRRKKSGTESRHSGLSPIETPLDWTTESEDSLPELEREFGLAGWIDPQTGEPAQGQSPPHLDLDTV
jgi:hypothetical protein